MISSRYVIYLATTLRLDFTVTCWEVRKMKLNEITIKKKPETHGFRTHHVTTSCAPVLASVGYSQPNMNLIFIQAPKLCLKLTLSLEFKYDAFTVFVF